MFLLKIKRFLIICSLLVSSGCATVVHPPTAPYIVTERSSIIPWTKVLISSVDKNGRVDFQGLSEDTKDLQAYVAFIARVSPESYPFPNEDREMAYYMNSYNALAMFGVINHNIPKDFFSFSDKAKFFKFTEYIIGGRPISLYDYENKIIRPLGDPRVHFALNCMVVSCPRLPQKPFQAGTINDQLDKAAREFVNSDKHVQVDKDQEIAKISEIFKFYKEDFVNSQQSKSLIKYINRYRTKKIPENFDVEFLPYNWTINRQ